MDGNLTNLPLAAYKRASIKEELMKLKLIAFLSTVFYFSFAAGGLNLEPENVEADEEKSTIRNSQESEIGKIVIEELLYQNCLKIDANGVKINVKPECQGLLEDLIDGNELVAGSGWCVGGKR